MVLVYCPSLQEDFATTAAKSEANYGYVERVAEKRSIAQIYLAREFEGLKPETLGIDTCCHFNPLGTTEVAKRISAVVGPLVLE